MLVIEQNRIERIEQNRKEKKIMKQTRMTRIEQNRVEQKIQNRREENKIEQDWTGRNKADQDTTNWKE